MDRTILFDGICNLCNGAVRFILRHDRMKKFRFVPLQSDEGKELLKQAGLPEKNLFAIIYINGENYYQRSTAVLKILKDIGGIWKLFYGLILVPPFIRDFLYNVVAGYRYRIFGKGDECKIY